MNGLEQVKNFTIFQFQSWATDFYKYSDYVGPLEYDPNRTIDCFSYGLYVHHQTSSIRSCGARSQPNVEIGNVRMFRTNDVLGIAKIKAKCTAYQYEVEVIDAISKVPMRIEYTSSYYIGNIITTQEFKKHKHALNLLFNIQSYPYIMKMCLNSYLEEYVGTESKEFLEHYFRLDNFGCNRQYETQIKNIRLNPND